MTFLEAVSACLSKYATFSGRARRSEYWFSGLAFFLALMAWGVLFSITGWEIIRFLATAFMLGCILPLLAVSVRRLHDVGRSGWWLLIRAVPLVGDVVIFVFCCTDSQPFTNGYGPSPKAATYPQPATSGLYAPTNPEDLPFYQARRQALTESVGRQRYDSGEPKLDFNKVDDYFDYAKGKRPPQDGPQKRAFSFSRMSRKSRGLIAAGAAFALLLLGIAMGAGSDRTPPQTTVQAAAPQATNSIPQSTPTQQVPVQPTVPTTTATPPAVQQTSTAPVVQPGDLGITSPLRPVDCTGKFIVIYHSSVVPASYAQDVQANLASHPGSKYLLTLGSCSSLNRMSASGTMIYAVYGGPFETLGQACVAASRYADEAYVKVLDNTTPPDQSARPCS